MLINLISNRSFHDLYQYPVFPLLYFPITKEKGKIEEINRNLSEHIGCNSQISKASEDRTNKILETKELSDKYKREDEEYTFYFNSNYSNFVFTSGFLIRLFPYIINL